MSTLEVKIKYEFKRGKKIPADQLADVKWPVCSSECAAIEYLGAGECESVCPSKFGKYFSIRRRNKDEKERDQ